MEAESGVRVRLAQLNGQIGRARVADEDEPRRSIAVRTVAHPALLHRDLNVRNYWNSRIRTMFRKRREENYKFDFYVGKANGIPPSIQVRT